MTDDERAPRSAPAPDWARLAREMAGENSALAAALRAPEPRSPTPDEVDRALASVMARRARWTGWSTSAEPPRWSATRWAVAAALLVAALTPAWFLLRATLDGGTQVAQSAASPVLLETRVGQVDSVRLADGTLVVLAPASRLEASSAAGASPRTVVLHGDGYFDVVHDEARPFTVLTPNALVRDVGTRFVVRGDASGASVVTVRTGEVSVTARSGATAHDSRLRAGDRGTVAADGAVRVEHGVDVATDASWISGRLVLRDAGVSAMADAMRRWYGLDVRVEGGALRARRVTATFEHESGADAARIIAAALGASSRTAGDTVWMHPAGTPP